MTIRFLVAPSMSRTTAILRAFENNPHVKSVYYQPLKSSLRKTGKISYDFFKLDEDYPEDIYIVKNTIGKAYPTSSFAEITYKLYRNAADLKQARYIFLLRNPFNAEEREIEKNVLPVYQEIQKLATIDFPI